MKELEVAIYLVGDLIDATPKGSVIYGLAVIGGCWVVSKTWKFLVAGGMILVGARLWIGS